MAPSYVSSMIQGTKAISKRLITSYVFDWIALILLGGIALGFSYIDPNFRPFSLLDLSISFPFIPESISITTVAVVAVIAPAIIIVGVIFLFVPGPAAWSRMSKGEILRIKLWEFNVGWLGLALAHVTQFLLVQGMKNLFGKPRPDMLERCNPDLNNISKYVVGGFGQDISPKWVLVNQKICQQTDREVFLDGFRSFPSGHNATIWAGMLYLSLWLASKFGIGFPVLPYHKRDFAGASAETKAELPIPNATSADLRNRKSASRDYRQFGYRDEAAAPPTWTLFFVYVPIGVALYIGATRFFEYYHHGFDVIAGSFIGILTGWVGFRWYNGPIGRSAGWAWSPRSRDRAFGVGVGSLGYVTEQRHTTPPPAQDLELGSVGYNNQQPQIRTGWQRDQYESVRSSAGDDRNGFANREAQGNV